MLYLALFFLQLFILFLVSRKFTKGVSQLLFRITKSKKWTFYLYALLFFPGTFIHEMAHFLTALFLLVPVGEVEFIPIAEPESAKAEEEGSPRFGEAGSPRFGEASRVKLGSVSIGKTDFIRRFLVGVAPFAFGVTLMMSLLYFVSTGSPRFGEAGSFIDTWWKLALVGYVIFEIGNTMFLSKRDLEGAWKLLLFIVFLIGVSYILGFRFTYNPAHFYFYDEIIKLIKIANVYLLAPILIDLLGIGLLRLLIR